MRSHSPQKRGIGWHILVALALSTAFFLNGGAPAQAQIGAGISVNPKFVSFEGRKRSAVITLMNKSDKPVTYRIGFKHMRMMANGSLIPIEKAGPGELFAEKLIRYSPRQVTIPAGLSQSIRLALRKPSNLPAGEYRSQLLFKVLPPADSANADIEKRALGEKDIRIRLVALISLSIPVFVFHGDLSFTLHLSDLALLPAEGPNSRPSAFLKIHRKGNRSASGDLSIFFKNKNGEEHLVGFQRSLSIYNPLETRTARVNLVLPEGVKLKNGELRAVLRKRTEDNTGDLLSEIKIPVP